MTPENKALVERARAYGYSFVGSPITVAEIDLFRDLAAALQAAPSPSVGWRTIESAPRDGTPILITRPTEFVAEEGWHVVRWEDGWWQVHDGKHDHPLRGPDPTAWQPLPPPPAQLASEKGYNDAAADILDGIAGKLRADRREP